MLLFFGPTSVADSSSLESLIDVVVPGIHFELFNVDSVISLDSVTVTSLTIFSGSPRTLTRVAVVLDFELFASTLLVLLGDWLTSTFSDSDSADS